MLLHLQQNKVLMSKKKKKNSVKSCCGTRFLQHSQCHSSLQKKKKRINRIRPLKEEKKRVSHQRCPHMNLHGGGASGFTTDSFGQSSSLFYLQLRPGVNSGTVSARGRLHQVPTSRGVTWGNSGAAEVDSNGLQITGHGCSPLFDVPAFFFFPPLLEIRDTFIFSVSPPIQFTTRLFK